MIPDKVSTVRLCEKFMETNCRVSLTTAKCPIDPSLDSMMRACAVAKKARARLRLAASGF